jgi:hypothetical protein
MWRRTRPKPAKVTNHLYAVVHCMPWSVSNLAWQTKMDREHTTNFFCQHGSHFTTNYNVLLLYKGEQKSRGASGVLSSGLKHSKQNVLKRTLIQQKQKILGVH